jgi:hypothetical protein
MFKKWFGSKNGMSTEQPLATEGLHRPYADASINALYNLLFCDDMGLLRRLANLPQSAPWDILLAEEPPTARLMEIAEDASGEGRVRAMAYHRLRAKGCAVPSKQLLGAIVEVALKDGLDVLAAFSDGSVRYFNHSGKAAIFEGQGNPVEAHAKDLLASCQCVVEKIGAWDKPRLPPPKMGNVRLTFLVSDGLCFGEGPFNVLQRDGMAGPVLAKAANLLQRAVSLAVERGSRQP